MCVFADNELNVDFMCCTTFRCTFYYNLAFILFSIYHGMLLYFLCNWQATD